MGLWFTAFPPVSVSWTQQRSEDTGNTAYHKVFFGFISPVKFWHLTPWLSLYHQTFGVTLRQDLLLQENKDKHDAPQRVDSEGHMPGLIRQLESNEIPRKAEARYEPSTNPAYLYPGCRYKAIKGSSNLIPLLSQPEHDEPNIWN